MQPSFTAKQIAEILGGTVEGDSTVEVNDFSKIEEGRSGTLSFLANPKYTSFIYTTKASIVLVNNDFVAEHDIPTTIIRVANAYFALAVLLDFVEKSKPKKVGIEPMSYIASTAKLGDSVYIGAFAYIGENVTIGENVKIYPHVYIGDNSEIKDNTILYSGAKVYHKCTIGKNCILHSGSVIGADGFGFAPENGQYKKIPQMGRVIIEDNVEIGANTTVDRAVMDATIIHQGVKLDNLIQVAHNVEIGKNTVIAAQTGVSGSTKVGEHGMIGGQVGLAGHIHIGNNVSIGAQSGVSHDLKDGVTVIGSPVLPVKNYFKSSVIFAKLPSIYNQLGQMQKDIDQLKIDSNKE